MKTKVSCLLCSVLAATGALAQTYQYSVTVSSNGYALIANQLDHGTDELLAMDRGGQRRFYHSDDLGSVRKVTDATGSVIEQYRYRDYGAPSLFNAVGNPITTSAIGNPYLFTGRRYDPDGRCAPDCRRRVEAL